MPKFKAWYQASRPKMFTASLVPMGVAGLITIHDQIFNLSYFLLAVVGVFSLQTAANLINEYYDYKRGAEEKKQAGQSMVIKQALLSPKEVMLGAIITLVIGILIGLFFVINTGILVLIIGIGGVLVVITYTAGPFPLAYNGLGEIAVGLFMGPAILIGTYFIMNPAMDYGRMISLFLISTPFMVLVAAILHANNIRDIDADRSVNKKTLAVRLGLEFARKEYAFLIGFAYISQLILIIVGYIPVGTLLSFITLIQARKLIHIFNTETDPLKLHPAQGQTAQLYGRFGLLVIVGWIIQSIIIG